MKSEHNKCRMATITSVQQDKLMSMIIDFAASQCFQLYNKTTHELAAHFNRLILVVDRRLDSQLNETFDAMTKIDLGGHSHHVDLIQIIVVMVLAYIGNDIDHEVITPWIWLEENFRNRAHTLCPCDHIHTPIVGNTYEFEIAMI